MRVARVVSHAIVCGSVVLISSCSTEATDRAAQGCSRLNVWSLPAGDIFPALDSDTSLVYMQVQLTKARLNLMAYSVEYYCHVTGGYPSSIDDVLARSTSGRTASKCVLNPEFLDDAWGNKLEYVLEDQTPSLVSIGPDGVLGTEDDIVMAQPGTSDSHPIDVHADCTADKP